MIRFNLDELPDQILGFSGKLARQKRMKPPGRWRPRLGLSVAIQQDEDSDQWEAYINWTLLEDGGAWPCRDTGKHETISWRDPADRFKSLLEAEAFSELCTTAFRDQYNKWILKDFQSLVLDTPDRG